MAEVLRTSGGVTIVRVTTELAQVVARTMHPEEQRHVAACGLTPDQAVAKALELCPQACVGIDLGEVLGMFGVVEDPNDGTIGVPWLLTTSAIARHRFAFLRAARAELRRMAEVFPFLENRHFIDDSGPLRLAEAIGFKRMPSIYPAGQQAPTHTICVED